MEHNDTPQELSPAPAEAKAKSKVRDAMSPFKDFCKRYPEALECLVYDV